jgi:hypothetical protein
MDDTLPTSVSAEISPPIGERKREAWDKLRGYHYQVWYAVLLWIDLPPDQDVFIECAEDVDRGTDDEIVVGQVKARAATISLNTDAAMEALSNFWKLKELNSDRALRFNYITTGEIVQESARFFTNERKGLEVWESAKQSDIDAEEVRAFLLEKATNFPKEKTSPLPPGIVALLKDGSTARLQEELIRPFSWYPNAVSFDKLQQDVADKIYAYSVRNSPALDSTVITTVKNALFTEASNVASSRLNRRLTARSLTDIVVKESEYRLPRAMLREPSTVIGAQTGPSAVSINWAAPSSDLEAWPVTVGNGRELDRPELALIQKTIKDVPRSAHLLFGEAGAGKSALLSKLGRILSAAGLPHLGIKADFLRNDLRSLDQLVPDLNGLSLVAAIRAIAAKRPFVVLVDQLDALCSLVDRHTNRLTIILQFLREVGEIPGVHIVASCRPFEFASDIRLQTLNATAVQLSLPTWDQVAATLRMEDVNPDEYPAGNREVLRVPWNLKLFLELAPPRPVMTSFYDLVSGVWDKAMRTAPTPERCLSLVELLARRIDESEEFWLPEALADAYVAEKEHLIREGILMRLSDHRLLGFRHQTFYDYFLLRIFLREQTSINDYVTNHEQSFFIRPTVARALAYLRATSLPAYHRAIRDLLLPDRLRFHLFLLVLEFVGHQQDPTQDEINLLLPSLNDEKSGTRFLQVIIGSRGWFTALRGSGFEPAWMGSTRERALSVAPVLASAASYAEEDVVALLTQYWTTDSKYDDPTLWVMSRATVWGDALVACLNGYAARLGIKELHFALEQLTQKAPAKAAYAVGVQFQAVSDKILAEARAMVEARSKPAEDQLVPDESEQMTSGPAATSQPADATEHAQRLRSLWHEEPEVTKIKELLASDLFHHVGLGRVAKHDPEGLLNALWPSVKAGLEIVQISEDEVQINYARDGVGVDHGPYANREESILWCIEVALVHLSQASPTSFLAWVDHNKHSESLTVHRLIAAGMTSLGPEHADSVIHYLSEDRRRYYLGDFQEEQEDSWTLLEKFSPLCSIEVFEILVGQIINIPRDLADTLRRRLTTADETRIERYLRKNRVFLLSALPAARLNTDARNVFDADKQQFGERRPRERNQPAVFVGPPVTTSELGTMSEDEIVQLVQDVPDSAEHVTEPRAARDIARSGGSDEQARALAEFAITNPTMGRSILQRLQPGQQEKYAAALLLSWSDPDPNKKANGITVPAIFPATEIEQLAIELNQRGFHSSEFRVSTARVLQKVSKDKGGLLPEASTMLQKWLSETAWPTAHQETVATPEECSHSILFSTQGTWMCPGGRAPIVEAIVLGSLLRRPPAIEETVAFLEGLAVEEKHPAIWAETLIHLPWLFGSLSSRMSRLVDSLFSSIPAIFSYHQTAYFLGQVVGNITPKETEERWILTLVATEHPYFRQLAGELVFLSFARKRNQWAEELIFAGIAEAHGPDFLRGLTCGAAAAIEVPGLGREIEKILTKAIESPVEKIQDAAANFLLHINDKQWSPTAKKLVLKLLGEQSLSRRNCDLLAMQMQTVALVDSETALAVAEELTRKYEQRGTSPGWSFSTSYLTNIALAAQRSLASRERGLVLFEKLLELNLHDARKAADLMNHR